MKEDLKVKKQTCFTNLSRSWCLHIKVGYIVMAQLSTGFIWSLNKNGSELSYSTSHKKGCGYQSEIFYPTNDRALSNLWMGGGGGGEETVKIQEFSLCPRRWGGGEESPSPTLIVHVVLIHMSVLPRPMWEWNRGYDTPERWWLFSASRNLWVD